jgi:subtilase family serine protease
MKHARLIGSLTAVTTLTLGTAAAVAAPGSATATGASGSVIPGTQPLKVTGAVDLGAASAATRSVTLVLDQRDTAGLKQRIASHAAPLSAAQFDATYAPSQSEVNAVRSWASASGLSVGAVPANRAYVRLTGSQRAMQSALGVAYHSFRTPSGTSYTATTGTATLPASVRGVTASVLGLSSAYHVATTLRRPTKSLAASSLNFPSEYGPKDIASLYDAPSAQTGSGQTVAVIAEGDLTTVKSDLTTFENTFSLPHVPFNQITVGTPSSDTSGADEYDLDTQYSTGLAPDVSRLDVYDGASLSDADILATIDKWVSDNTDRQASFSAGECEVLAEVAGFTTGLDTVLQQAVAQGQTLFTSSGDNGAYCMAVVGANGAPVGVPDALYPASSPGVIGVGGTTVLGSGPTEISWYAGGGGTSFFEPAPAYQSGAGGSYLGDTTGLRGVPDVSLDADPNSGYNVIVSGQSEEIGGTSASAPSWQGIWARAQGAHSGSLGFAGPVLYRLPATAFNDITIGTNGLYPATPGYDYTTGRGTPDIAKVVSGS